MKSTFRKVLKASSTASGRVFGAGGGPVRILHFPSHSWRLAQALANLNSVQFKIGQWVPKYSLKCP